MFFSQWRRWLKRRSAPGQARPKSPEHGFVPRLEALEDRCLPSTFSVLNTNDSGPGSLRQAIVDANANAGSDVIGFNLAGGGVQTIAPLSPLPTIMDAVLIDGTK